MDGQLLLQTNKCTTNIYTSFFLKKKKEIFCEQISVDIKYKALLFYPFSQLRPKLIWINWIFKRTVLKGINRKIINVLALNPALVSKVIYITVHLA